MSTRTDSISTAATPAPRFDFPTWLPSMFVKELRQGLRTRGFVGSMVGFQVIMVIAFVWAFATHVFGDTQALQTVNGFFWGILGVMLLGVTPLRAMAGLRQEIDAKTLDLLMLTQLTAWRIVLGKWTSLLTQAALLVLALLPYGMVRYFFGSVDLVQDCSVVALMFLGCAVLTALALWVSGLPKLLRFGLPFLFFLLFQMVGGPFFSFGRFSFASGGGAGAGLATLVFDGLVVLVFFLVLAVRRIAPPAENHSPSARGLALLLFLPVPLLFKWAGTRDDAMTQLWFAVIALGVVAVIELSTLRIPMAVHVRSWWRRGAWGRWVGPFVLPGWPSAALFSALGLTLAAAGAWLGLIKFPAAGREDMLWLFVLLWTALVFPMMLLSFVPRVGRQAPLVYLIIQGLFGILCIMENSSSAVEPINPLFETLRWLFHGLPVSSFWLETAAMNTHPYVSGRYFAEQFVMVALVGGLALWRMTFYWQWVRTQAVLARREKAEPAA